MRQTLLVLLSLAALAGSASSQDAGAAPPAASDLAADAPSAEIAVLTDTVAEQTAKVRGMEEELSRERRALAEKHTALRAAKEEEARRRASLRRTLTIA